MGRQARSVSFDGFRAYMPDGETYGYIQFHQWSLILRQTNTRTSVCGSCGRPLEAGQGIAHHEPYGRNGFICLECARGMIRQFGGSFGFGVNAIYNLQCCYYGNGTWTARQVADAIKLAPPTCTPPHRSTASRARPPCTCSFDDGMHEWNCAITKAARRTQRAA